MKSLASTHTVKEIRTNLENLPEGENAISDTYEGAFSRIRDQRWKDRQLGEKVIMWISHAQEPLTLKDLQCILTMQEGDTELELDDLISGERLISTCAGLITVENLSGTIRFVHSTAQEYVDSIKSARFPGADVQITKSCIQYLSLSTFCRDTRQIDTIEFSRTVSKYPFLGYAALNWGLHARVAESTESKSSVEELVKTFFNLKLQSIFAVRTLLCGVAGVDGTEMGEDLAKNDRPIRLINILAYFGLDALLADYIASEPEVMDDSFDQFVGNVLHWATLGQHQTTLKLLLDQPSASNIINQRGYSLFTPLHVALVHKRDLSAEILLQYGPDVTVTAVWEHTPLLVAALNGNSSIIPKLLATPGGMKTLLIQGHGATTPFRAAAMWGHKDVMVHLLHALDSYELDGNLWDLEDDFGRNPLHAAAQGGYLSTCEVLLQSKYGVQFATSTDGWGYVPMELAIIHGHVEVTELFLNWGNGALMASEPGPVAGALAKAASFGQPKVADMLLARHPEACQSDFRDFTALHHAAYSCSVETVKVIFGHSTGQSALEVRDTEGNTPLIGAADRGQAEIVEYLIESGAMVNARNRQQQTSLHLACGANVEQVIKILLRSGIDIDAEDSNGRTALAVAVELESMEAIRLLLAAGARIPEGVQIPETIETANHYLPEKPVDQFRAYFYVKKASGDKLSQRLISHIMDLAGYWLAGTTEHCEQMYATRYDGTTLVYLRTPPVLGNSQQPVKRIEYEIVSHDQGYSSSGNMDGAYDGSYTWFEASRECIPGPFQGTASRIIGPEILRNVRARYEWSRHRVSWCTITGVQSFRVDTDPDSKEEVQEPVSTVRYDHRIPKPEPVKWITEINTGERLVVTALAQFPGWENQVQRAKIVVYTSCLKFSGYT
jgi:ankyrin repeat protein